MQVSVEEQYVCRPLATAIMNYKDLSRGEEQVDDFVVAFCNCMWSFGGGKGLRSGVDFSAYEE